MVMIKTFNEDLKTLLAVSKIPNSPLGKCTTYRIVASSEVYTLLVTDKVDKFKEQCV